VNTATFAPYAVDQMKKRQVPTPRGAQQQPATGGLTPGNADTPNTPPAQNPQAPTQAPAVPQASTFAQLQAMGQARPAPPPAAAAPAAPWGPNVAPIVASGTPSQPAAGNTTARGLLQQLINNPSSYDSEAMNREYQNKGLAIDDEYTLAERDLQGEMARRGIFDSNIAGDRTRGLLLAKRDAKTSLAESLLQKLAETQAEDRRSAASLGLQTEAADRAAALQGRSLSLQQDRFNRELELDRERLGISKEQFDRQFGETQRQYDLGRGDRRHEFDTSSIRDFIELLGGYEGLGALTGGVSAPPPQVVNDYTAPVPQGSSGGGGGISPEELLELLQY
jgi:hypothetical protein